MIEKFKQEFGSDFDTCNVFRLDDIILYKGDGINLEYCVTTKTWDNEEYAKLIPKDVPIKLCQLKRYVFRNTYLGTYINTFLSGNLTTGDLKFLYPEYEFIVEQATKLKLPFVFNAFRQNCDGIIKNINATSLVKATEMSAKQLAIFQQHVMCTQNDALYYFIRLNKIVPSFKGLNEDVFNLLCSIAMNDRVSNLDLEFYCDKILSKPGNIQQKLNKVLKYIEVDFIEYHAVWEALSELDSNMDISEYPEFPKPADIPDKISRMQLKIEALGNEAYYKSLNIQLVNVLPKLKEFAYSGSKYSIIAPQSVEDLDYEGNKLHHCVGSYKENLASGKEFILFLRKNECLNAPYYTIDIDTDGYIRQIHTVHNKNISDDENKDEIKAFLDEWGIKKSNIVNQKSIKLNYGALCAK